MSEPFVIDFGSVYSLSATTNEKGVARALADMSRSDRTPLLPNALSLKDAENPKLGWEALEDAIAAPEKVWTYLDPPGDQTLLPEGEHQGLIFKELARRAGSHSQVLVTIPDDSDEELKTFLTAVAERTGLQLLSFLDQTDAAALAYTNLKDAKGKSLFLHLGGNHFKVALYDLEKKTAPRLVASRFTREFSGLEISKRLAEKVMEDILMATDIDPASDASLVRKIRLETEKGKCAVSHRGSYDIKLIDEEKSLKFEKAISRYEVENVMRDLITKADELIQEVLKESATEASALNAIYFVGGGMRMPAMGELVEKSLGKRGVSEINLDQVVALGAALHLKKMMDSV